MSKIVKKADLDILIESTLKTAGIKVPKKKKIVKENNDYFRFDPNDAWMDKDDIQYDELPDGDYEDIEYETYGDFESAYPDHKHFMGKGPDNFERSSELFDKYKSKFGPMRGKRLSQNISPNQITQESKKSKKPLINENIQNELNRFNKLTNFKY